MTVVPESRATMNGKPVYTLPYKTVINMESGFQKKLLCDGPTFTTGTACPYTCAFCYVPAIMRKTSPLPEGVKHEDVVIRRKDALELMRSQLVGKRGVRFPDPQDNRVIYASPLTDVAANMELVRETIEACRLILEHTHWQIRLLSKSNLLPKVAAAFSHESVKSRIIYGVSTGTLDDNLAAAFELGTPLVNKRIQSLHWLQDNGFRTFGMICPSLPHRDYREFAWDMQEAIRGRFCEHVWAEVINVRGDSMVRTTGALRAAGYEWEAGELERVAADTEAWEDYSMDTFIAHHRIYAPGKLRFLQYVNDSNREYWAPFEGKGAVLL